MYNKSEKNIRIASSSSSHEERPVTPPKPKPREQPSELASSTKHELSQPAPRFQMPTEIYSRTKEKIFEHYDWKAPDSRHKTIYHFRPTTPEMTDA